jgi:NAD(P)-dependent dehydrogenase (short-subunit alcohol dehydrogenase family)
VPRTIVITGTSSGSGKLCVQKSAAEDRNAAATVMKMFLRPCCHTEVAGHRSTERTR